MTELFWVISRFVISAFQFEGPKLLVIDKISICLHDYEVSSTVFLNFHKLWKREVTSWGKTILQNN